MFRPYSVTKTILNTNQTLYSVSWANRQNLNCLCRSRDVAQAEKLWLGSCCGSCLQFLTYKAEVDDYEFNARLLWNLIQKFFTKEKEEIERRKVRWLLACELWSTIRKATFPSSCRLDCQRIRTLQTMVKRSHPFSQKLTYNAGLGHFKSLNWLFIFSNVQKLYVGSQVWWHTPLTPALLRHRQAHLCGFEASLGYIMSSMTARAT